MKKGDGRNDKSKWVGADGRFDMASKLKRAFGAPSKCVCLSCGHEQKKEKGVPCKTMVCSNCGAGRMRRVD